MARKTSTSLEQIKEAVKTYVTLNKISNTTYEVTRDNTLGLIDKIGKQIILEHAFVDKLSDFEGEMLNLGKDIEEGSIPQLVPDEDYDADGAVGVPNTLVYMKPSYSKTLPRRKFQVTIYNNDIERASLDESFFAKTVAEKANDLVKSEKVWRYAVKRQTLGDMMSLIDTEMAPTTTFAKASTYTIGSLVKDSSGTAAIFVKDYTANAANDFDDAIKKGYLVKLELTSTIAKPTDTASGEAFIEEVMKVVEIANDNSEHSLNGGAIGAEEGLILFIPQGIIPPLKVKTYSGAFHREDLEMDVELRVIKDFGSYSGKGYALLMDKRAMRLFNNYHANREDANGNADCAVMYAHTQDTAWFSRNAFVHMFKVGD